MSAYEGTTDRWRSVAPATGRQDQHQQWVDRRPPEPAPPVEPLEPPIPSYRVAFRGTEHYDTRRDLGLWVLAGLAAACGLLSAVLLGLAFIDTSPDGTGPATAPAEAAADPATP